MGQSFKSTFVNLGIYHIESLEKRKAMTITTEFGPPNYLPTAPFTQKPLSNQWEANVFIMKAIKEQMNISN